MGREEQVEEFEVLESIFADEFTKLADDECRIAIKLDLPDDVLAAGRPPVSGDGEAEEPEPPVMLLTVRYPEAYPDVAPLLELSAPQSPQQQQQQQQHPYFNVAEDKDELLAGLDETITENLGVAMVFTLVSVLKDAAEQVIIRRHEGAVRVREEALLEAERAENQKFHGTPVTPESFVKWQTAFLKEMAEKRQRDEEERLADLAKRGRGGGGGGGGGAGSGGGVGGKDGQRLTGRQLWERGLVGKVDDDDVGIDEEDEEDDNAVPTEDVRKLKLQA